MSAAVVTAKGMGDGLIMLVAANAWKNQGYQVHLYNDHLPSLERHLPGYTLHKKPSISALIKELLSMDLIFLQFDKSPLAEAVRDLRRRGKRVICVYSRPVHAVHQDDLILNHNQPAVDSLQEALSVFLQKKISKDTGIVLPSPKKDPDCPKVLLHPLSSEAGKNWRKSRFIALAKKLQKAGYTPIFCLSPEEKTTFFADIPLDIKRRFYFPDTHSLSDLVSVFSKGSYFIGNDSGPAHLASLMGICSFVLSGKKIIQHWQPGWRKAEIIKPAWWIPNWKSPMRFREDYWAYWISSSKVMRKFQSAVAAEKSS